MGLQNRIDDANRLGFRGRHADAIAILEKVLLECDRSTFTGNDLWLQAQRGILAFLGCSGLRQHQNCLVRFDAVGMDFDDHSRRTDWPEVGAEIKAKVRHCEVAWERVRTYSELGRLSEALEAAKYANDVLTLIPDSPERDEQRACLLIECAGVLQGLDREEDAIQLADEAVEIIRTGYARYISSSGHEAASAIEELGCITQRLGSRLDDLGLSHHSKDLAVAHLAGERRIVELEPDAIEAKFGLARSTEALAIAYHRLGDDRSCEHLEAASGIYRSLAEHGDIEACTQLARIQRTMEALQDQQQIERVCTELRKAIETHRTLWLDDRQAQGPAFLDVLRKFCDVTNGYRSLDDERHDALVEAVEVIDGLSEPQKTACAPAIGRIFLSFAKSLTVRATPDKRLVRDVLDKARFALAESQSSGDEATGELAEVEQLQSAITPTLTDSRASAARRYEEKRQQLLRRILVSVGAIFVLGLGLLLGVVFHEDDGMRCAKIEVDVAGEQVCTLWESEGGITRRTLPPSH